MQAFSEDHDRQPSLELLRFSTTFQQWDVASSDEGSGSPTSCRGSQQFDGDYPPTRFVTAQNNVDFNATGTLGARQRTTQACDKCRERKTKCSGDHPVCKRCTTRGLICYYSGRGDRVRGPAKARLRTALDAQFAADLPSAQSWIKQEDMSSQSFAALNAFHYTLVDYEFPPHTHPPAQEQRQTRYQHTPSASSGSAAPSALDLRGRPQLSRMSLPQMMQPEQLHFVPTHLQQQPQEHHVRRVQSQSALGASLKVQTIISPSTPSPKSHLGRLSVVEFDLRQTNAGHLYDGDRGLLDDGGWSPVSLEPQSATASVFSNENASRSSESSEGAPRSPVRLSEFDVCRMTHPHAPLNSGLASQRLGPVPMLNMDAAATNTQQYRLLGFHSRSPAGAIAPAVEVHVPQINGTFRNPWAEDTRRVTVCEVELVCPSPKTPIRLGSGPSGLGDLYMIPDSSIEVVEARTDDAVSARAFSLLNSPLTTE